MEVSRFWGALQFAAEGPRSDRDIVTVAVSQFGLALEHAAPELRADRAVVLAAVSNFGRWLSWEQCHPFQNHYTHKITIFELFRGLQLQLSGSVELICITVTVSLFLLQSAVTENTSPQEFSEICSNYSYIN